MTDLIATIAKAMWDVRERTLPERTRMKWEAGTDGARSCCWLMAEEALTAINEAGYEIVSRDDLDLGNNALMIHGFLPIYAITTGETGE